MVWRTTSKPGGKPGSKSGGKKRTEEHALFREVLVDLDKELQILRGQRKRMELKLSELSNQLGNTQNKEIDFRNKISQLMKQEAILLKKRSQAKDKVQVLSKKIEKVSSVGRQLREE